MTNIELCVMCGEETPYTINTHIDFRYGYVEGVGQLCRSCYSGTPKTETVCVSRNLILDTPNDAELGGKVRKLYYENNS